MARMPSRVAEAPTAPPVAAPAPAPSVLKPALVAGLVALIVLAAGGGAAWYLLGERAAGLDGAPRVTRAPVFVDLEVLTVNLRDRDSERFLQTRIVLEMRSNDAAEALKLRLPAVRNEFLLLLSGKTPDQVLSRDGKEKLAAELLAAVAKPLAGTAAERGIEQLLFSHFIVQ